MSCGYSRRPLVTVCIIINNEGALKKKFRRLRQKLPFSPPAKRASSADSSGYDTDLPDEVQQDAYTVLST